MRVCFIVKRYSSEFRVGDRSGDEHDLMVSIHMMKCMITVIKIRSGGINERMVAVTILLLS